MRQLTGTKPRQEPTYVSQTPLQEHTELVPLQLEELLSETSRQPLHQP